MRLWSGSLKYREVMVPTAPVLSTGPSSISMPQAYNNSFNEAIGLDLTVSHRKCGGSRSDTFRCAATWVRGVLVMRHRSVEPEVGCFALGSNSCPSW